MFRRLMARLSMRSALMLFLWFGILLPVMFFAIVFYGYFNDSLRQIEYDSALQTVENNAQQLESIVENISHTAVYISTSEPMQEYLYFQQTEPNSANNFFARDALLRSFREISNATLHALNPDIALVLPSGRVLSEIYTDQLGTQEIQQLFATTLWQDQNSLWFDPLQPQHEQQGLTSYWAIREQQGRLVGLLRVRVPQNTLWEALSSHPLLQYRQEIINQGEIISSQGEDIPSTVEVTVLEEEIPLWGMRLRVTVPSLVLVERMQAQSQIVLVFFAVLLLFLLSMTLLIARLVSKPIRKVVKQMEDLQQGDFSLAPPSNSFRDINLLSSTLNEVSQCIQGLMNTAAEQASLKERSYYDALMAQINPHFLYNTLASIRWLANFGGNTTVADMLRKLGNILHYSFGKNNDEILLCEELDFLKDYIDLLQMRYGNALQVEEDIPEKLMKLRIPRFCLQPLVENAVVHGILSVKEGHIHIWARQINEHEVTIVIEDNGLGMEQTLAEEMLKKPRSNEKRDGIGVWNVQQRIRLLYRAPYGLSIQTAEGQGYAVTVRLPYRE